MGHFLSLQLLGPPVPPLVPAPTTSLDMVSLGPPVSLGRGPRGPSPEGCLLRSPHARWDLALGQSGHPKVSDDEGGAPGEPAGLCGQSVTRPPGVV